MNEPARPKPYVPRVSSGIAESVDGSIEIPGPDVLYPGETADIEFGLDEETGEVRYSVIVGPSPGFTKRLVRLRYRVCRFLPRRLRGKPHLTVKDLRGPSPDEIRYS